MPRFDAAKTDPNASPHIQAAAAIIARQMCLDRGRPTTHADAELTALAARIEATPALRADPILQKFSRLSATLIEGDNGKADRTWEELRAIRLDLVDTAASQAFARRAAALDEAHMLAKTGDLADEDVDGLQGIDERTRDALRERAHNARLSLEAERGAGEGRGGKESWELRALRGALSADEAVRLAAIDPRSDDRQREQHRRALMAGGEKALAAVWFVLQLKRAALQIETDANPRAENIRRLVDVNEAIGEVDKAMKAGGWDAPELSDAQKKAIGMNDGALAARPARQSGGLER